MACTNCTEQKNKLNEKLEKAIEKAKQEANEKNEYIGIWLDVPNWEYRTIEQSNSTGYRVTQWVSPDVR